MASHLTKEGRDLLAQLLHRGFSQEQIAETRKLDDQELNAMVRRSLVENWSPEPIAGAQKLAHPQNPRR